MPPWATRITTIGQSVNVLAAIAAVVILALKGIIDGAAAIAAMMLVTGASAAVTGVVGRTANGRENDKPFDSGQVQRG